jgi:outer membrane lipoprotein-sorting protein
VNILRRLPLSRLLLLGALVLAIGVSATALAFALGSGPTPPPKPLAHAIHDALAGADTQQVQGVSASITLTDHLLEGANLAGGGQASELTSNPLITGASGRLWIANGHLRLELQSQAGDTQILYDGHTLSLYDAATNTLYHYTPPAGGDGGSGGGGGNSSSGDGSAGSSPTTPTGGQNEVPSVAKIEEAIAHLSEHADVSGATPTDVAGQAAYTVRVSPNERGSLFGGVELSWEANNGVPLRAAIYSSTSASPVIELAATAVSYGPVASSVFEISPPADAKIEEVAPPSSSGAHAAHKPASGAGKPKITTYGHGPTAIAVLASSRYGESKAKGDAANGNSEQALEGLPKVTINGTSASELRTELGTLLTFERSGVRYLLAGSVTPATIEALARGL